MRALSPDARILARIPPMTDKTDDSGNGPTGPGDGPRRPHATLDLKATEVGRGGGSQAAPPGGPPGGRRPDPAGGALPPPPSNAAARQQWTGGAWVAGLVGGLAAVVAWAIRLIRGHAFLSHAAAGVAGAALTLAVAGLLGLFPARLSSIPPDVARRLAVLEQAQARQPLLPAALADKLAAADKRLSDLEHEQAEAIAVLKGEQAKLAAEAKALQGHVSAQDTAERIAKLEKALATLSTDSANTPAADRLAAKLADVERLSGEAAAAKAAVARFERDLAALKAETAGLRHGLAALKASVEEAVPAKIAGIERDLQAVKKTEGERVAGAQRVLLALEIANLKRALDRGHSYARELEAAKKAMGGNVGLAALEPSSATGVPTLGSLAQDFKRVASAALDAAAEQPDASVLDRLMAGARSVVRLRKTHYAADDTSAEATLARMEAALKDGDIGEVLAQSKRLPPKAAAAAAGWLGQLEARHGADKAVTEIEAALKSSLAGAGLPEPEPKR
jgi:hypothetical protein